MSGLTRIVALFVAGAWLQEAQKSDSRPSKFDAVLEQAKRDYDNVNDEIGAAVAASLAARTERFVGNRDRWHAAHEEWTNFMERGVWPAVTPDDLTALRKRWMEARRVRTKAYETAGTEARRAGLAARDDELRAEQLEVESCSDIAPWRWLHDQVDENHATAGWNDVGSGFVCSPKAGEQRMLAIDVQLRSEFVLEFSVAREDGDGGFAIGFAPEEGSPYQLRLGAKGAPRWTASMLGSPGLARLRLVRRPKRTWIESDGRPPIVLDDQAFSACTVDDLPGSGGLWFTVDAGTKLRIDALRLKPLSGLGGDAPPPAPTPKVVDKAPEKPNDSVSRATHRPNRVKESILGGLCWLARHQNEDGGWSLAALPKLCGAKTPCFRDAKRLPTFYDEGLTGLALLCFLREGFRPEVPRDLFDLAMVERVHDGGAVVRRGLEWLAKRQHADGSFSRDRAFTYNEAIATTAMCEAYAITHDEQWKACAQKGVDFLQAAQRLGSDGKGLWGWRYESRAELERSFKPGSDRVAHEQALHESDTSVTGWCVGALDAARSCGLRVNAASIDGAMRFCTWITRDDGLVGYSNPDSAGLLVTGQDDFFVYHSPVMSAIGMSIRRCAQGNRKDPFMELAANRIVKDLPADNKDEKNPSIDYYYWHHATLALNRFDGPASSLNRGKLWGPWNKALLETLLALQSEVKSCNNGGWLVPDRWAHDGQCVYTTAINVLTLLDAYPPRSADPVRAERAASTEVESHVKKAEIKSPAPKSDPQEPSLLTALPDPGNLVFFRHRVGETLLIRVVGKKSGRVYGNEAAYTDDSELATAVVHAGILQVGQAGVVKVTLLKGLSSYPSSNKNGIVTMKWDEPSGGSFKVEPAK